MNNNSNKNKNYLKENALIVGLYGVVGVLVVTAGVLTVQNIQPTNEVEPFEAVDSSITKSYTDGEIGTSLYTDDSNYSELTPDVEEKPKEEVPKSEVLNKETIEEKSKPEDVEEERVNPNQEDLETSQNIDMYSYLDENGEAITTNSTPAPVTASENQGIEDVVTVAMYTAYNEGDKMQWPVTGEVVLPYSNILAIYDPTLEQFRTNELVSIKSSIGDEVKASAEGQVVEISSNEILGNYVEIQHGNGWSTMYGQLDNITVSTGDVVPIGGVIGETAKSTKYSVALGDHIDFKVVNNEKSVNPENVLVSVK